MTTLADVTTAKNTLNTNILGLLNTYIDGTTVNRKNALFMIELLANYSVKLDALNTEMLVKAAAVGAV